MESTDYDKILRHIGDVTTDEATPADLRLAVIEGILTGIGVLSWERLDNNIAQKSQPRKPKKVLGRRIVE